MDKIGITVGIDIGGTNTVVGFVSDEGENLCMNSFETQNNENAKVFVSKIDGLINKMLLGLEGGYYIKGIGIAAPGGNNFTGYVESPSNLNWGTFNIVDMMSEYFNIPIALTNDANAAALGEMYFGKAQGYRNFAVITLGTGLGSGIVVNGEILYGGNGLAGELGHTIVVPGGRECNCGRRGCLETYVSASGIKRTVQILMGELNYKSELRYICFNDLNGRLISDAAKLGDPIALEAYRITGQFLGKSLADMVACFSSEIIILFGGLAEAGDLLLIPTIESFENNLLNIYRNKIKIEISDIQEGMSAIFGAASLINNSKQLVSRFN